MDFVREFVSWRVKVPIDRFGFFPVIIQIFKSQSFIGKSNVGSTPPLIKQIFIL